MGGRDRYRGDPSTLRDKGVRSCPTPLCKKKNRWRAKIQKNDFLFNYHCHTSSWGPEERTRPWKSSTP